MLNNRFIIHLSISKVPGDGSLENVLPFGLDGNAQGLPVLTVLKTPQKWIFISRNIIVRDQVDLVAIRV